MGRRVWGGKSITSEVRGHQVLPLVQIGHPGLRSLLHNHLGGRRVRMKDTESNLVFFLPHPTVALFEVHLSRPTKMFPFLIPLYLLQNLWEHGLP